MQHRNFSTESGRTAGFLQGTGIMELLVVSGMSGAGKTVALKTLEDLGYYCVDNLPVFLIPRFAELCMDSEKHEKVAVGVDIRSGSDLEKLGDVFMELDQKRIDYRILFLEASDRTLVKRFKETRRDHPLERGGRIEDGIQKERVAMEGIKERADYLIDTSSLLTKELRKELEKLFAGNSASFKNLVVTIMSFGFKFGIPQEADLVFDVRFLPNPYYVAELKDKTGLDRDVNDFVLKGTDGIEFETRLFDMIDFLLPRYVNEGKNQIIIAMGCTGGKHRSVTMAERLYSHVATKEGYIVKSYHRDLDR